MPRTKSAPTDFLFAGGARAGSQMRAERSVGFFPGESCRGAFLLENPRPARLWAGVTRMAAADTTFPWRIPSKC